MGIYKDLRQMLRVLGEEHDSGSYDDAMKVARDADKLYTGILYQRSPADKPQAAARIGDEAGMLGLAEKYR
jgi:hypothetical protein